MEEDDEDEDEEDEDDEDVEPDDEDEVKGDEDVLLFGLDFFGVCDFFLFWEVVPPTDLGLLASPTGPIIIAVAPVEIVLVVILLSSTSMSTSSAPTSALIDFSCWSRIL